MLLALALAPDLNADLDRILQTAELKNAVVCARVEDLDGQLVFDTKGEIRVVPASNQKLFSCAYALFRLGPDHRTRTRFWILEDRIVVDSSGDPMMTHDQLVQARRALSADRTFPVYVRQAYNPGTGPGWEWDDLPNKYAAPVSAFTVDRGSYELWTENGRLFYQPRNYGSRARHLGSSGSLRVRYSPEAGVSNVFGKLPAERTRLDTLALKDPWKAAGSILGSPVLTGFTLPDREPNLVIESPPVKDIVKECLSRSDNNIAEHLLLLAAKSEGPLSEEPWQVAGARLSKFLAEFAEVPAEQIEPADGSGLSRANLLTARSVTQLLRWAHRQPTAEVWFAALALPGRPGTLQTRLSGSTFRGKTGTLTGACSLSGYLTTAGGKTLVVSLIMNNYRGTSNRIREIQDQFIRRLEADSTLRPSSLESRGAGTVGTHLALPMPHESDLAHALHRTADRNRPRGYDRHGMASRQWSRRRDEPADEAVPRHR